MSQVFEAKFRVYYEDTDAGGVVYHANYLNFMLRTRTEWIRSLPPFVATAFNKVVILIKSANIDYTAPAYLDDALLVRSTLTVFKPVSALFFHEVYRYNTTDLLCTAEIKVACLNPDTKTICRWPRYEQLTKLFCERKA